MRVLLICALALAGCAAEPATATVSTADAPEEGWTVNDTGDTADALLVPAGGTSSCDQAHGRGFGVVAAVILAFSRRRRPGRRTAVAAALLAPTVASASPALDLQRLEPAHPSTGFATVHAARILPRGRLSFDALGSWAYRPFVQAAEVQGTLVARQAAIEHLTSVHLRLGVAPTEWLQVTVGAPVVQFVTAGPGLRSYTGTNDQTVGWGDVSGELTFLPLDEPRGAGVAISVGGSGPSGSPDLLLTRGVGTAHARLSLSGVAGPVHVAGHVGYRLLPGSSTQQQRVAVDDGLMYGLGFGFLLHREVVRLNVETFGVTTVGPGLTRVVSDGLTSRLHSAIEANGSLRVSTPTGFAVLVGGGAGLTPAPGTPAARVFLGLAYAPSVEPDADGDGISNWDDDCRKEPEDVDGFQDADGCPDADNDADGLRDEVDDCPDDPEDFDDFQDADGCPDRDNDGDRIADTADTCPNEAEDRDRYQDTDGCPDLDNDGDGLPDLTDRCPDVPEDFDGFSDDDGCPEEEFDTDADGVIDNFDPCPTDPEDVDGFQDDDGCPEPDNDGDTILDPVDRCPNEPEIFNGESDDDGCPDDVKAVFRGDHIEVLEKIYFFVNEARIRPESFDVLEAVASTLLDHPEVTLLRVEGHTDGDGSDDYNLQLSQRRAESVRDWLSQHGVNAERLLPQGYGEQFPVATNRTPEGKEMNRRVEFVVVPPEDVER
jgi:outer membrane protein OmpA-like peptidoglycan-associated protein